MWYILCMITTTAYGVCFEYWGKKGFVKYPFGSGMRDITTVTGCQRIQLDAIPSYTVFASRLFYTLADFKLMNWYFGALIQCEV